MNKSQGELARKRTIGFVLVGLVCFFNTLPLFIISLLANLSSVSPRGYSDGRISTNELQLTAYVPFLETWQNESRQSFSLVSGVLPPVVSGIFGFFLPIIMRHLSQYMGALTHSRLDRAVTARYFAFLVISQLVIFTLIGVIFSKSHSMVPLCRN